jgi:hypothetical protein
MTTRCAKPIAHVPVRRAAQPPSPTLRPAAIVYTILRHSRGLSHEDAARRANELLPEPPPQAA